VDAARLTLDGDARPLLGEISARGWREHPVTIRQLLSHTAGLDTRWIGMAAHHPRDVQPLATYLARAMPPLIDVPGNRVRYSNFGYAAVGRAVEVTSGLSWSDAVERRILQPLGMTGAYVSPREPDATHAVGYRYRSDTMPEPALYENVAPAGALHATASDMARLMIAVLDTADGALSISPASKRLLLHPAASVAPGVRGYAFGTFEYPNTTAYAATMGGELPGFSTRMLFVPAHRLGVVIMVNRKDPTLAVAVFDSLLRRLPTVNDRNAPPCAPASADTTPSARLAAGKYRVINYDHSSFLRIGAVLGPVFEVREPAADGFVLLDPLLSRFTRWVRRSPNSWSAPTGQCMGRMTNERGGILALSTTLAGPVMLERPLLLDNAPLALGLITLSVVGLLGVLVVVPIRSFREGIAQRMRSPLYVAALGVAVGQLALVTGFVAGLYLLAIAYDDRFAWGLPAWFRIVLALPYLLTPMTAIAGYLLFRESRQSGRVPAAPAIAVIASTVLLVFTWAWSIPG
jgi:CubicO group peptidase (beta-lactamase class C family)